MRGLGSALELLRTSRSDDQQRATRVGLATNGAQRRAHELAHAPSESGARHSRDLRGGPREREVFLARHGTCVGLLTTLGWHVLPAPHEVFAGARWCAHHERADAPRPFEATWRARKSTTSATGIAVSAALCARPGRALLSAGRPKHTDQGRTNRCARASPLPQLHMRKGVNRNPSRRPDG